MVPSFHPRILHQNGPYFPSNHSSSKRFLFFIQGFFIKTVPSFHPRILHQNGPYFPSEESSSERSLISILGFFCKWNLPSFEEFLIETRNGLCFQRKGFFIKEDFTPLIVFRQDQWRSLVRNSPEISMCIHIYIYIYMCMCIYIYIYICAL